MTDRPPLTPVAIDYSRFAELYDSIVDFDDDIAFFVEEARRAGGPVLELMCGTGRVSVPLLEAGVDLTCVDASSEMLEILRDKLAARGLEGRIVHADVRNPGLCVEVRSHRATLQEGAPACGFDASARIAGTAVAGGQSGDAQAGGFPLAILPFNSFSELIADDDRSAALSFIHSALTEGGRFICTLHNPGVRLAGIDGVTRVLKRFPHPSGRGLVEFRFRAVFDAGTRLASGVEIIEEYDENGKQTAKRTIDIRFSLLERTAFEALAASAGFSVLSFFGDYDRSDYRSGESPFMIWILGR